MNLSEHRLCVDHPRLLDRLVDSNRLLIIQDLDGVCMGLVRDPLTRTIDTDYVAATKKLDGCFYVLTNGEHTGRRGANRIVAQALASSGRDAMHDPFLPGLAAGGVQLQSHRGEVTHPGVSDRELAFLAEFPNVARRWLTSLLSAPPYRLATDELAPLLDAAILDNAVSPTVNINTFHHHFGTCPERYRCLQQDVQCFMQEQLERARAIGLGDAFFVHYAPNLGREDDGGERLLPGDDRSPGTLDFQFMLSGAIKEVGVLVLLNLYYFDQTGTYPLGEDFNARNAPRSQAALLRLARERFAPRHMPRIVGVGDTVSSHVTSDGRVLRGGSDRGFLTLVQDLGHAFATDNAVLYVDSSGGEVRRPGIDERLLQKCAETGQEPLWDAVRGISDENDPLHLNFVFPGGHRQYIAFFIALAERYDAQRQHATAGTRA